MANKCIAFNPVYNRRGEIVDWTPCGGYCVYPTTNPRYCDKHGVNLYKNVPQGIYTKFRNINTGTEEILEACYDKNQNSIYPCDVRPGTPISLMGSPRPRSPMRSPVTPRRGVMVTTNPNRLPGSPRGSQTIRSVSGSYRQAEYEQVVPVEVYSEYEQVDDTSDSIYSQPTGRKSLRYTGPAVLPGDKSLKKNTRARPIPDVILEVNPPRLDLNKTVAGKLLEFDVEKDVAKGYAQLKLIVESIRAMPENEGYSFNVQEPVVDIVADKLAVFMNNSLRIELILSFLFYYESRDLSQPFSYYGFKYETTGTLPFNAKLKETKLVDLVVKSDVGAFPVKPQAIPDNIKTMMTEVSKVLTATSPPRGSGGLTPAAAGAGAGAGAMTAKDKFTQNKAALASLLTEAASVDNLGNYMKGGQSLSAAPGNLFNNIKDLIIKINAIADVQNEDDTRLNELNTNFTNLINNTLTGRGGGKFTKPPTQAAPAAGQQAGRAAAVAGSAQVGANAAATPATPTMNIGLKAAVDAVDAKLVTPAAAGNTALAKLKEIIMKKNSKGDKYTFNYTFDKDTNKNNFITAINGVTTPANANLFTLPSSGGSLAGTTDKTITLAELNTVESKPTGQNPPSIAERLFALLGLTLVK